MANPVSSTVLNLSAPNAAASGESARKTASGASKEASFSRLLDEQRPRPTETPQTTRQTPETKAKAQDSSTPTPQTRPQNTASAKNAAANESAAPAADAVPSQPIDTDPPTDAAAATIAALLNGIAGELAQAAAVTADDGEAGMEAEGMRFAAAASSLQASDAEEPQIVLSENGKTKDGFDKNRLPAADALPLPAKAPDEEKIEGKFDHFFATAKPAANIPLTGEAVQAALLGKAGNGNQPFDARIAAALPLTGEGMQTNFPILPGQTPNTASATPLPQFNIPMNTGIGTQAEEIGNRIMWMLGRAETRAELVLTPPHLGKVEVSIHLSGDQGTAQFLASSQAARDAIEAAMPRLRELLAQAGITLGEASVNTSTEGKAQDGENAHRAGSHIDSSHDDTENSEEHAAPITAPHWHRLNQGLVNTFA